jgi:predicted RND superfamily exporter protein
MVQFIDRCNAALASLLVRGRVAWFAAALLLTLAAAVYLFAFRPLKYNRSMEGFFPAADPSLQLYLMNKDWFGGEATLLVAYHDPKLWTPQGMKRQLELAAALRGLSAIGVKSVNSLAESPAPRQPWQTIAEVVAAEPDNLTALQEQVRATSLYQGVFVADDLKTAAMVIQLRKHFADADELAHCLEAVRTTAKQVLGEKPPSSGGPAVVGTHLLIHDVYQYTEADGTRLQIISVALMGLVIAVSFRSVRWVVLPFLVIYAALYWAESLWALWRGELTMVSSAISSLVAVIGVCTVVHYGMHYRELRRHYDTHTALRRTLYDMNPPVFWMLLTTAAGFASLLICELKPVLDFAWIMVLATLLAGVATLGFLPFVVVGFRNRERLEVPGQNLLGQALRSSLAWIQRRPALTIACLLIPAAVVASGMYWLTPQTDFTNNFHRDTELYQAYDFVETRLGGAGQLDVVFDVPDLLTLDDKQLKELVARLRALQKELGHLHQADGSELPGVTKVLGLVDFLDFFEQTLDSLDRSIASAARNSFNLPMRVKVLNGDVNEARQTLAGAGSLLDGIAGRLLRPERRAALKAQVGQVQKQLDRFEKEPPGPHFWNRQAGKMRVTLQTRERLGGAEKVALIEAAQRKTAEVLGESSGPHATGIYLMLTNLITSILDDQRLTFALALLFMFTMGLCAFRNLWLALIAMVPTVLPIVVILGTMGWLGLPVNIATAMLASVAMGMTIDSSLLYIYRFKQERQNGADFASALERTHTSTGLALIVANIALVLGFGVLALSQFIPLVHFGILTGLALFGGMLGNLLLLPLLLSLVPGFRGRGKPASPGIASPPALPASAG